MPSNSISSSRDDCDGLFSLAVALGLVLFFAPSPTKTAAATSRSSCGWCAAAAKKVPRVVVVMEAPATPPTCQ